MFTNTLKYIFLLIIITYALANRSCPWDRNNPNLTLNANFSYV